MQDILKAKSETPFPRWGRVMTIIVGLALLSYSIKTFFTVNIAQMKLTFPYALFGISCLFIGGFQKQVFVSSEGVLRIYRAWGASGKDMIGWDSVEKVFAQACPQSVKVSFKTKKKTVNAEFTHIDPQELESFINRISPETEVKIF